MEAREQRLRTGGRHRTAGQQRHRSLCGRTRVPRRVFRSADGGDVSRTAIPRGNCAARRALPFTPDNVHRGPDGRLYTAGMANDVPDCGGVPGPNHDLARLSTCPRGTIGAAIDARTMQHEIVVETPAVRRSATQRWCCRWAGSSGLEHSREIGSPTARSGEVGLDLLPRLEKGPGTVGRCRQRAEDGEHRTDKAEQQEVAEADRVRRPPPPPRSPQLDRQCRHETSLCTRRRPRRAHRDIAHLRLAGKIALMSRLVAATLSWLARKAGLLLLILCVLLVGGWLRSEWNQLQVMRDEIGFAGECARRPAFRSRCDRGRHGQGCGRLARPDGESPHNPFAWSSNRRRSESPGRSRTGRRRSLDLPTSRRQADAPAEPQRLREVEVQRLEDELRFWDKFLNPEKLVPLTAARARQQALDQVAKRGKSTRDRLRTDRCGLSSCAPAAAPQPVAAGHRETRRFETSGSRTTAAAQADKEQADRRARSVARHPARARRQDPRGRLASAVRAQLPVALAILAAALLLPLVLKTFFYFVLAPLAGRLPAIRILPNPSAPRHSATAGLRRFGHAGHRCGRRTARAG